MSQEQKIDPQWFATMAHRDKQELLSQWPAEDGGWILDVLYGHQYNDFIYYLVPDYCSWRFLQAGGESEHIVKAGEIGRRTGMEAVAADPFSNYSSGSPLVIQAEIRFSTDILHRAVIRYAREETQRLELRYPSVSLDAPLETPDGEACYLYEELPDPIQVGDPLQDILERDALQGALSKLTPETGEMVERHLFTDIDISAIALERRQPCGTVQRRLKRGENRIIKELRRAASSSFDRDARIADGHRRLLQKIFEDLPP